MNLPARMQSVCYVRCVRRLWGPAQASQILNVTNMHRSVCQLHHKKVCNIQFTSIWGDMQDTNFGWGKKMQGAGLLYSYNHCGAKQLSV